MGAPSPPGASVSLPTLQERFSGQTAGWRAEPHTDISLLSMSAPLQVPTTARSPGQSRQRAQPREARFRDWRASTNSTAGQEAARAPRPHRPDPPPPPCEASPYLVLVLSARRRLGQCARARTYLIQQPPRRPAQARLSEGFPNFSFYYFASTLDSKNIIISLKSSFEAYKVTQQVNAPSSSGPSSVPEHTW